ncbi:MAG: MerR family DNA-binding protein [Steroidobacteraceae bacterium]
MGTRSGLPEAAGGRPVSLTIGKLAHAAQVGVETVRYYQRLKLLPTPAAQGAYRRYPAGLIGRIRFIKRAQELGFSLAEVGELLKLQRGGSRNAVRGIATRRLLGIQAKISDLQRMRAALEHLLHECRSVDQTAACPIIEALAAPDEAA